MGTTKNDLIVQLNKTYGKVELTLKNQLLPEEKLAPTPSQNDGLDVDTEIDLRIYGCELIQTAGILLRLPQVAMATGQVLLQRFYYSKSFVRHPVDHTAMACVCLASKIEEAPRRVRDVINVFTHIRQVNSNKTIQPVIPDHNYIQLKNLVIKAERRVLKELGFCVHIKHPHKIIVMYLQVLGYEKNQKLMQYSWNYMNDSLRTDAFVRYQPETVACACIYLTARKLKLPLPKNPTWYAIFGATEYEIKDIAIRILKLYNRPKPNIEILERKVDELSKKYHDARAKARGTSNTPTVDPSSPNTNSGGGGGIGTGPIGGTLTTTSSSANNNVQLRTAGAHNAWGGFISRSGSHVAPPFTTNDPSGRRSRTRSRSTSRSPPSTTTNTTTANTTTINTANTTISLAAIKHGGKRSKKTHNRSKSRTPTRNNHKRNHKRRSYTRSRSNSPHKRKIGRGRSMSTDRDPIGKNDARYIDRYDEKKERHDKYKKSKHDKGSREERSKDRRR